MNQFLNRLKAAADESRLRILFLLEEGELCVCEIQEALGLAQSTVSRHLQVLEEAGLVQFRRRGLWKYYRYREHPSASAQALLSLVRLEALGLAEAGEMLAMVRTVRSRADCGRITAA